MPSGGDDDEKQRSGWLVHMCGDEGRGGDDDEKQRTWWHLWGNFDVNLVYALFAALDDLVAKRDDNILIMYLLTLSNHGTYP